MVPLALRRAAASPSMRRRALALLPSFSAPLRTTAADLPRPRLVGRMVTVTKTEARTDAGQPAVVVPSLSIAPTGSAATDPNGTGDTSVVVTESCAMQIKALASQRSDDDLYLRVYVDAGGCSGFQYKFELESDSSPLGGNDGADGEEAGIDPDDDVIFERDGARVVIDRTSLGFVRGSTIDYVREMIRSSFAVVDNPVSESACGCGSSFAVKNFSENSAKD